MIVRAAACVIRRFADSTRGIAAVEFAVILPMLLIVLLATIDAGRAIAVYMKVRSATYTLDAIANQYSTIHDPDMQQILGATSVVLEPYPSPPVVVIVSQIAISSGGAATISWSDSLNGTAHTKGSAITIPAALATPNTYLIFGEVSYNYTPLFGYFGKGGIHLSDNLYASPRSSVSILRASP